MRLQRVTVKGLFGVDHDISFPSGESVVIIHGPNGFGKTVMLRMIGALVAGQSEIFQQIPFRQFSLDFDDGSRRIAFSNSEGPPETSKPSVIFQHSSADGTVRDLKPPGPVSKDVLDLVDPFVPLVRFRSGWRDGQGRFFSLADV